LTSPRTEAQQDALNGSRPDAPDTASDAPAAHLASLPAPIPAGSNAGGQADAPGATPADPDLAAVIAAWATLPAAVRAGIVATVRALADAGTIEGGK